MVARCHCCVKGWLRGKFYNSIRIYYQSLSLIYLNLNRLWHRRPPTEPQTWSPENPKMSKLCSDSQVVSRHNAKTHNTLMNNNNFHLFMMVSQFSGQLKPFLPRAYLFAHIFCHIQTSFSSGRGLKMSCSKCLSEPFECWISHVHEDWLMQRWMTRLHFLPLF